MRSFELFLLMFGFLAFGISYYIDSISFSFTELLYFWVLFRKGLE